MKKKSFIIVAADDDLDDQDLLKQAFIESPVKLSIYSVYDGMQLMDFLLRRFKYKDISQKPDLILLDLNMPLMDGFQVLGEIRKFPELSSIPIYVVTTSKSEIDKKKAIDLGASGFYSKGASSHDIKKIVKEVCIECFSIDY